MADRKKNIILKTERLTIREIERSDAEDCFLLNADPEVLKYTADEAFASLDEATAFWSAYDQYEKYGIGRWAVIRTDDEAFLGWCGLKYSPSTDEYDIGYRLMKKYWGYGYATEAASACLDHGMQRLDIRYIIGKAMHENEASIRILQKIGMTYLEDRMEGDIRLHIFEKRAIVTPPV